MSEEKLQLFNEWKKHSITKQVFQLLETRLKLYRDWLESEGFLYKDHYERHCAKLVGAISTVNMVLNVSPKDLEPQPKDQENAEVKS